MGSWLADTLERRFWARVDKRGEDECWPWTGNTDRDGYGEMRPRHNGKRISLKATHLVLALIGIGVPAGAQVLHSCDNPGCCNPSHLRVGTHAENMAEKVARGRQSQGENHGAYKDGRFIGKRNQVAS